MSSSPTVREHGWLKQTRISSNGVFALRDQPHGLSWRRLRELLTRGTFGQVAGRCQPRIRDDRFPRELVHELERLPGFRNVIVHDYVALDMERVIEALDGLEPLERFLEIVRNIESA